MKIANKNAREYVEARKNFQGSNMFGKWLDIGGAREKSFDLYAVFSYGSHFPMYVFDPNVGWIGNKDKYSSSTTRQQSHTRPSNIHAWYSTDEIKEIVWYGSLFKYTMSKARQ